MSVKFRLIAAVCENMGIGYNGDLPWRLSKEMAYFNQMTKSTKSENRKNVVIMGRKTWDSIPKKFRPLKNRINFILSKSDLSLHDLEDVYHFKSLDEAVEKLKTEDFKKIYENVWIVGGCSVYSEALHSEHFYRLYLTKIEKHFDCDTYFPTLPQNILEIRDEEVPNEKQEENGIQYTFHVYERQ